MFFCRLGLTEVVVFCLFVFFRLMPLYFFLCGFLISQSQLSFGATPCIPQPGEVEENEVNRTSARSHLAKPNENENNRTSAISHLASGEGVGRLFGSNREALLQRILMGPRRSSSDKQKFGERKPQGGPLVEL